jgi:hypothetical protein
VAGDPWNHNSRQSCHARSLPKARPRVKYHLGKIVWCPRIPCDNPRKSASIGEICGGQPSLPSKVLQLFLGADELHRAVIEQDQAALGVMIVEREQLGSTMLIPASTGLE